MTTDPAYRHGGPDAGWYRPVGPGWLRISDGEVGDHGDAAHFMSDPNGRHDVPMDTADQVIKRVTETYHAAGPPVHHTTMWVMDRTWYDRLRSASGMDKGEPSPDDLLFAIPVKVREDGGEPHLEPLPA